MRVDTKVYDGTTQRVAWDYASPGVVVKAVQLQPLFVIRYFHPESLTSWKNLRPDEIKTLHANGIGVMVVVEASDKPSLHTGPKGTLHGANTVKYLNSIGYPKSVDVVVAVDYDVTVREPVPTAYLNEFRHQLGLQGYSTAVYGDYDTLLAVSHWGSRAHVQMTNSFSYVGGSLRVAPNAAMLQYYKTASQGYDTLKLLRPVRCWLPNEVVLPSPVPVVNPIKLENEAMFTNAEPRIYGNQLLPANTIYWRYNDAGIIVHIETMYEVKARGSKAVAFVNSELDAMLGAFQ